MRGGRRTRPRSGALYRGCALASAVSAPVDRTERSRAPTPTGPQVRGFARHPAALPPRRHRSSQSCRGSSVGSEASEYMVTRFAKRRSSIRGGEEASQESIQKAQQDERSGEARVHATARGVRGCGCEHRLAPNGGPRGDVRRRQVQVDPPQRLSDPGVVQPFLGSSAEETEVRPAGSVLKARQGALHVR